MAPWLRSIGRYALAIIILILIIAVGVTFDWAMDTLVGYPQ